jgi:hypothetical protein
MRRQAHYLGRRAFAADPECYADRGYGPGTWVTEESRYMGNSPGHREVPRDLEKYVTHGRKSSIYSR